MRKSTLEYFIVIVLSFIGITACEVFLEEDIENDQVEILSPIDGTTTEIVTHTFWWDKIDGADKYRLQLVSPSFDASETVLTDTLVSGDKYEMTLYPGQFEWRIRAENSAYVTDWSYAVLNIIASDDLTRQTIRLRKPLENYFTNETAIEFQWDTIPHVDTYELRIYKGSWLGNLVLDTTDISQLLNRLSINELEESELWWGVRAINEKSESMFNSSRLVIDQTKPNQPTLEEPGNNATLTDTTVVFKWNSSDPQWNDVKDSLLIYEKRTLQDVLVHAGYYEGKTHTIKLNNDKTYRWLVKSVDKAGNESIDSEVGEFKVEQ
ncbi:hypothetical protein KDU71_05180 [Carboxylicivirga sediminis]|uniref:Fibronectin type-III domain-containing protein n=1 Tax=Carboxylicivirga sediminis TaxID=2006564 RepID=A0A941IW64_9BACT|nr:hypothetical protein [Carboxylicivirga sediminis]MBR8534945.1 hypothetical protein [Carboxylicivirga sediminis]